MLIGIVPTEPHTGYGYIKNGSHISGQIYGVKTFKEKPDLLVAKQYLEEGGYLWNSGMFIAKCSVLLQEIKTTLPDLYARLQTIKESGFDPTILDAEFRGKNDMRERRQTISVGLIDMGYIEMAKDFIDQFIEDDEKIAEFEQKVIDHLLQTLEEKTQ